MNLKTKNGWCTLTFSCEYGYLEILKFLVENNADLNLKNKKGETLVFYACNNNYIEIAKYSIDRNANLHLKTNEKHIAFTNPCKKGDLQIVELLLKKGAKINNQDEIKTPFIEASKNGHMHLVDFLGFVKRVEIHGRQDIIQCTLRI